MQGGCVMQKEHQRWRASVQRRLDLDRSRDFERHQRHASKRETKWTFCSDRVSDGSPFPLHYRNQCRKDKASDVGRARRVFTTNADVRQADRVETESDLTAARRKLVVNNRRTV